jgi:lipoate-protein ligase A
VTFDFLYVWIDPIRRLGPEAMAVDEWLLEHAEAPVLRVYRWHGEWGSIGYFGSLADAKASFPVLDWVRRWTGGGTVDHRQDWTYSVVAPAVESLSIMRGDRSYRLIHAAVAEALTLEGIEARLSSGEEKTGASLCFENPVNHDLVGKGGRKLAGAGQRRTRSGLLHQGSVAAACSPEDSSARAGRLATALASAWSFKDYSPPEALIAGLLATRYARVDWTQRR